jgi:hypothetical protein
VIRVYVSTNSVKSVLVQARSFGRHHTNDCSVKVIRIISYLECAEDIGWEDVSEALGNRTLETQECMLGMVGC